MTGPNVNESVFYGGGVSTQPLTANLGNITESSGQRYAATADEAGASHLFAFDVHAAQLQTLADGRLWVRVAVSGTTEGFRPAVPMVYGATRIIPPRGFEQPDHGQTTAIYEIAEPGAYLLSVTAAEPGDFEIQVDAAGDINADGRVNGFDVQLLDAAAAASSPGPADLDGDGNLDTSDRGILLRNYGFVGSEDQVYGTSFANGHHPGGALVSGTSGAWELPPEVRDADDPAPPSDQASIEVYALAATQTVATTAVANGNFNVTNPNEPAFAWRLRGGTKINNGVMVVEQSRYLSGVSQQFTVPEDAVSLRLEVHGGILNDSATAPLDALQITLLDALTQEPLFGPLPGTTHSDALLTFQADGEVRSHDRVTLTGGSSAGQLGTSDDPIVAEIDLAGVPESTELVIHFDLLGSGSLDSYAVIDNVVVLSDSSALPTANNDSVTIDEDVEVAIDVLANDTDPDGALDANSVRIVDGPTHGTATVDIATGLVIYTPVDGHSGTDSFTYTVDDETGAASNLATVSIAVNPITDSPSLVARSVAGTVNSPILLDISSDLGDRDGSETLTIRVSGLPAGAFLNQGTQIQSGIYELTRDQLQGLTITPPVDSTQTMTLNVSATAEESETSQQRITSATFSVIITEVVADPVLIQDVVINNGEKQRSSIHTVAIQFNQDVTFFHGVQEDVTIAPTDGQAFELTAENYTYDAASATLTIDTRAIDVQDGHYRLILSIDGVRGVADPASRLEDIDANREDGFLTLDYHQLIADFSGEDYVDRKDYDSFLEHYPSRLGDDAYDPIFDLNSDNRIDIIDFRIWRTAQGQTSDREAPTTLFGLEEDTGSSGVDGVTNNPAIVGIVNDTSEIGLLQLSLDGSDPVDIKAELGQHENLNLQVPPAFFQITAHELEAYFGEVPDGPHTVTVTAADVHFNTAFPVELDFILDTVAPNPPSAPDLHDDSDTGSSSSDNLTRETLPSFAVSDAGGVVATLYRGEDAILDAGVDNGTSALSGAEIGLANDLGAELRVESFTATTSDSAGNESSPSPALVVTFDMTPPARPTLGLHPDSDTSALGGDEVGDRQTTLATVILIGTTEPGATVQLAGAGTDPVTADAATGEFQFEGVALNLGHNPFTVESRDAAGNSSQLTTSIRRLGLELDPPDVQVFGLRTDSGPGQHDRVTNDPVVIGAIAEQHDLTTLKLGVDQPANVDILDWLDASGQFELSVERWVAITGHEPIDGLHTIELYAQDEFFNEVTRELSFTLDRTPPPGPVDLRLYSDDQVNHDTGPDDRDGITNRSIFTIVTGSEPDSIVRLSRTSGQQTVQTERLATSNIEAFTVGNELEALPDGVYVFQSEIVDLAGNNVVSAEQTVIVDTVAPQPPSFGFEGADQDGRTDEDQVSIVGQIDAGILVEVYPLRQPERAVCNRSIGCGRQLPLRFGHAGTGRQPVHGDRP